MKRNLSRRIEVGFPVYNEEIKQKLKDIIQIHWSDHVKARIIDKKQKNKYRNNDGSNLIRSQMEIYEYLKKN